MRSLVRAARIRAGAALLDWPRSEWYLRRSQRAEGVSPAWLAIRNRREKISVSPDGTGVECLWEWSSRLHLAEVYPRFGRRLLETALRDHPVILRERPPEPRTAPVVTFVIGHRGAARLPLLSSVLGSIAAQTVPVECVVVEQDVEPVIRRDLPDWVRYVHTPTPSIDYPYSRSWAFNVGAKLAASRVLVFHDSDILVPADYAMLLQKRWLEGWEFMNLKRFLFDMTRAETARLVGATGLIWPAEPPSGVLQNQKGGSIAADADAFWRVGGFDEGFLGWGGEDNDLWDRATLGRRWDWGMLPVLHYWHPPQPGKMERDGALSVRRYHEERRNLDPAERAEELRRLSQGDPDRPPHPEAGRAL